MQFDFLTSVRFWKLFIVGSMAGLFFLFPDNAILKAIEITVGIWFGGSVAVRTIDRANE